MRFLHFSIRSIYMAGIRRQKFRITQTSRLTLPGAMSLWSLACSRRCSCGCASEPPLAARSHAPTHETARGNARMHACAYMHAACMPRACLDLALSSMPCGACEAARHMSDTRSDVRDVERAPCVTEQRGRMRVMRGRWACERLDTCVQTLVFEVATCVAAWRV